MAVYIKGNPVANATSYKLLEKNGSNYTNLAEASEINFEVSALGLNAGEHILVVRASASGYADSDYSNEVTYTIESASTTIRGEDLITYSPGGLTAEGVWHSSAGTSYALTDVTEYRGGTVIISGGSKSIVYCFLTAAKPGSGTTASYTAGYSAPVVVDTSAKIVAVRIPDNAVYLYNYVGTDGTGNKPTSITLMPTYTSINSVMLAVDVNSLPMSDGGITSAGVWHKNSGTNCILYDVSEYRGQAISFTSGSNGFVYSFLTNTNGMTTGSSPTYATGYSGPVSIKNSAAVIIPSNAVYLYLYANSATLSYKPRDISIELYD